MGGSGMADPVDPSDGALLMKWYSCVVDAAHVAMHHFATKVGGGPNHSFVAVR